MFEISGALSLSETGWPRRNASSRRSAFARFTRYSASDIAPAIATAVAPSREKIFWTTLDPTKNPFEARLSAARTTPSLLRIPTVVVMSNLTVPMSRVEYVDSSTPSSVTHYARVGDMGGTTRRRDDETGPDREAQGVHRADGLLGDAPPVREGDDPDEGRARADAGVTAIQQRDREVRATWDPARACPPLHGGSPRFPDQRLRVLHGPRAVHGDPRAPQDGEVRRAVRIPDEPALLRSGASGASVCGGGHKEPASLGRNVQGAPEALQRGGDRRDHVGERNRELLQSPQHPSRDRIRRLLFDRPGTGGLT